MMGGHDGPSWNTISVTQDGRYGRAQMRYGSTGSGVKCRGRWRIDSWIYDSPTPSPRWDGGRYTYTGIYIPSILVSPKSCLRWGTNIPFVQHKNTSRRREPQRERLSLWVVAGLYLWYHGEHTVVPYIITLPFARPISITQSTAVFVFSRYITVTPAYVPSWRTK